MALALADLHLDSPRPNLRSSSSSSSAHPADQFQPSPEFSSSSQVPWDSWTHGEMQPHAAANHGTTLEEQLNYYLGGGATYTPAQGQASHEPTPAHSEDAMQGLEEFGVSSAAAVFGDSAKRSRSSNRLLSRSSRSNSPTAMSSYFSSGAPSPFRNPSATLEVAQSMDPTQSVRSSSPSSVSSVPLSRVGSSSAASSVYGGEGSQLSSSVGPSSSSVVTSASSRTSASQSKASNHHHHKSGSSASPRKGRGGRKLTNLDRKAICQYRDAHPTLKQDLIAEKFSVERSTVSKILKNKDHWLEVTGDDEESSVVPSPILPSRAASLSRPASTPATPSLSRASSVSATPKRKDTAPPTTYERSATPSNFRRVIGGRYPELDNALAQWARQVAESGTPLTDEALHDQALVVAASVKGCENFRASQTWLDGFKSRAGIAAGTFVDLLSPGSVLRIQAEAEAAAAAEARDEPEDEESDPLADDDDDDFLASSIRSGRRSRKKPSAGSRRPSQGATMAVPFSSTMATSLSPPASPPATMEVDAAESPIRSNFHNPDLEATPTHSVTHSRAVSKGKHQQHSGFELQYEYPQDMSASQGGVQHGLGLAPQPQYANPLATPTYAPDALQQQQQFYAIAQQSPQPASLYQSVSQDPAYSHTSPYDTAVAFQPYVNPNATAGSAYGSNADSPTSLHEQMRGYGHHGRSGSTASTTSSFSGLTAFSSSQSQNGTPLTGSLYGSFAASQSSLPHSVPSTPSYHGHGPDGTQSQLQAAFLVQQNSAPIAPTLSPVPPALSRRATISGGLSFSPSHSPRTSSQPVHRPQPRHPPSFSPSQPPAQPQPQLQPQQKRVSPSQAYAAIVDVLDFLSQDGQGIASPGDLVALADIKGKLGQAQSRSSPPSHLSAGAPSPHVSPSSSGGMAYHLGGHPMQQRVALGRSHSASATTTLSSSRRSHSSASLLSVYEPDEAH
ncbi:hypothetical protein MNV49_002468 [Pseudohyphozyma bogoriensis]|nr:hypothetical protein MNV49_002468 [Pseudohyphozyma bogoriensis]